MSLNKCSLSSIPLLLNLDPLLLQLDVVFKISFSYTEPWKIDSFSLAPWHPTTKPRQERMSHQRLRWGGFQKHILELQVGPRIREKREWRHRKESGPTGVQRAGRTRQALKENWTVHAVCFLFLPLWFSCYF